MLKFFHHIRFRFCQFFIYSFYLFVYLFFLSRFSFCFEKILVPYLKRKKVVLTCSPQFAFLPFFIFFIYFHFYYFLYCSLFGCLFIFRYFNIFKISYSSFYVRRDEWEPFITHDLDCNFKILLNILRKITRTWLSYFAFYFQQNYSL